MTIIAVDPIVLHRIEFEAGQSNSIVLSKEEAELTRLLIQEAEQNIVALEASLSLEKSRLKKFKVAIAPHKPLPPELLGLIFRYSAEGKLSIYQSYPVDVKLAPWALRQVCSLWRATALLEPSFWSNINFKFLPAKPMEEELARLDFWIKNMVHPSHSLSLDVQQLQIFRNSAQGVYDTVIRPYRSRIRRLQTHALEDFFASPPGSFPLLESLNLSILDVMMNWDPVPTCEAPQCFVGMDSLRSLEIRFAVCQPVFLPNTVPWHQLTSLNILWTKMDAESRPLRAVLALHVLRQCPQLECCDIVMEMEMGMDVMTSRPIYLQHLRSLEITFFGTTTAWSREHILEFLVVPSLVALDLIFYTQIEHGARATFPDLGPLIRRSGCTIRSLRMVSPYSSDMNITRTALDALTSLHVLRVDEVLFSDAIFEEIATGALLPNIRSLEVAGVGEGQEALRYLTELIERRSQPPSALNVVPGGSTPPPVEYVFLQLPDSSAKDEMIDFMMACLRQVKACGASMEISTSVSTLSSD
ncbi:hypothetical protein DXG01_001716 [Tephrocybe rancida]|nr:hypothetical protein DXG01_001716 [Tephrocybe rancida]